MKRKLRQATLGYFVKRKHVTPAAQKRTTRESTEHYIQKPPGIVKIFGDGRCLFRSVVSHLYKDLLEARRSRTGWILSGELAAEETLRADDLRSSVVSLLTEHREELGEMAANLPFILDSDMSQTYASVNDRIDMMAKPGTYAGNLEIVAVGFLLRTQLNIYQKDTHSMQYKLVARLPTDYGCSDQHPIEIVNYEDNDLQPGHFELMIGTKLPTGRSFPMSTSIDDVIREAGKKRMTTCGTRGFAYMLDPSVGDRISSSRIEDAGGPLPIPGTAQSQLPPGEETQASPYTLPGEELQQSPRGELESSIHSELSSDEEPQPPSDNGPGVGAPPCSEPQPPSDNGPGAGAPPCLEQQPPSDNGPVVGAPPCSKQQPPSDNGPGVGAPPCSEPQLPSDNGPGAGGLPYLVPNPLTDNRPGAGAPPCSEPQPPSDNGPGAGGLPYLVPNPLTDNRPGAGAPPCSEPQPPSDNRPGAGAPPCSEPQPPSDNGPGSGAPPCSVPQPPSDSGPGAGGPPCSVPNPPTDNGPGAGGPPCSEPQQPSGNGSGAEVPPCSEPQPPLSREPNPQPGEEPREPSRNRIALPDEELPLPPVTRQQPLSGEESQTPPVEELETLPGEGLQLPPVREPQPPSVEEPQPLSDRDIILPRGEEPSSPIHSDPQLVEPRPPPDEEPQTPDIEPQSPNECAQPSSGGKQTQPLSSSRRGDEKHHHYLSQVEYDSFDFGLLVEASRSDSCGFEELRLKAMAEKNWWRPTDKNDFPVSYHMKKGVRRPRSLNRNHMEHFPWVAVSNIEGTAGAWCSICVLFKVSDKQCGKRMGKLVCTPLTNFSDLTGQNGALSLHAQNNFHKDNAARAAEFAIRRISKPAADISKQLSNELLREIAGNRSALASIVETIKICALQNIPLRGHRDSGRITTSEYPATNDGNFKMLLRFRIQSGDEPLLTHLQNSPKHCMYTSNTTQNEILKDMCQMVQKQICRDVGLSPAWVLMADETTDRSNREQLAIVVRYLSKDATGKSIVREDPLFLLDVFDKIPVQSDVGLLSEMRLTGNNLAALIMKEINNTNLSTGKLVGQCYDGAANMSSDRVGVVANVKKIAPLADYFHCANHALNLATSKVMNVTSIRNAHGTMAEAIVFVKNSAKRGNLLSRIQDVIIGEGGLDSDKIHKQKLLTLCDTRFVERHVAVARFWEQLEVVVEGLERMAQWQDKRTSAKAQLLSNSILKIEFLVSTITLRHIAAILRPLSRTLQVKGGDLVKAMGFVDSVLMVLSTTRRESETRFANLFAEATATADKLGVEVIKPRIPARSRFRSSAGRDLGVEEYFRINTFNEALDEVIQDLNERFGVHQRKSMLLCNLLPKNAIDTNAENRGSGIQPLWVKYNSLLKSTEEEFQAEFDVWQTSWKSQAQKGGNIHFSAIEALDQCNPTMFPSIHTLLSILAVLPVSTAEVERVFSKVEKTLSSIRSSMGEDRLQALILLQAHREHIIPDTTDVVNYFSKSGVRRLNFRFPL